MQGRGILVALLVPSAAPGWAQTSSGSVAGNVVDAQHGAVPNSVVTATEVGKKFTLCAKTDDPGRFVLTQLHTGTYRVSAEAPGSNGIISRSRRWGSGYLSHVAREGEE